MELLVPLVVARVVGVGIAGEDKMYIVKGCLILVAFGAAGLILALTAQYFAAKAAVGTSSELRSRLFCKLQSLAYEDIDELGTSVMVTRMTSDVNQVQTGVNMTLRLLLRGPIIVFGAAAMAFIVNVQAALVILALIPVLAVVVFAVMAAGIPLYKRVQERLDGVQLSVRENLQGVRVIRAFCQEDEELQTFDIRNGALRTSQKKAGLVSAVMGPVTYVLVNLAVILLVWVGAVKVNLGNLEQQDLLALYSYISLILVELIKLANLIFTVSKAVSCQKRIGNVLDLQDEPAAYLPPEKEGGETAVSFDHVTFTYRGGGAPSLTDIHFSVKKGETVGILGGTGAGKSTLVQLIPRFYRATIGEVEVNGANVDSIPAEDLRGRIAIVPQKTVLFKGTIRSNLLWGNGAADDEALNRALSLAQAADVATVKGGLDGEIAQEGKNLSGGQRQRLAIARALVREPEILILDDSSSALDYATDARLKSALKSLDCTLFIVSQRISSVRYADKIVVLEEGRMAGIGTHEELLKSCKLYREISLSQGGEA